MNQQEKKLYVAGKEQPSFAELRNIAYTAALFNLEVSVVCWSEQAWQAWHKQSNTDKINIQNANQMTLTDFTDLTAVYDLIILHDIQQAYLGGQLAPEYAASLINQTSTEMILWT